jgi:hypothetical protein
MLRAYQQPGHPALETIAIARQAGNISVGIDTFNVRGGDLDSETQIVADGNKSGHIQVFMFGYKSLIQAESSRPDFKASVQKDPIGFARYLIELEFKEDESVGEPISILEMKDGSQKWVEKGACKQD